MTRRGVAIRLKIPDNEAYTALTALQRLGVGVSRIERSAVWFFDDSGDAATFGERVRRNETLYNPNKHELAVLDFLHPRDGEAWIEELTEDATPALGGRGVAQALPVARFTAWRLFAGGNVADRETLGAAVERLLCNPAIERALIGEYAE